MPLTWAYVDAIIAAGVGAPIDYQAFEELKANLLAIAGEIGTSTFAGQTGRLIELETAMPSTSYHVSFTPSADTGGYLGDAWFEIIDESSFMVYNTGSARSAFSWKAST